MHDWILLDIRYDWKDKTCSLSFLNQQSEVITFKANNVFEVYFSHLDAWGESSSVNGMSGPTPTDDAKSSIAIEMQSGDTITITAEHFEWISAETGVKLMPLI